MSGEQARALFGSVVVAVAKGDGHACTNLRTIDGDAICTTIYSSNLDRDEERLGWKAYEGREAMAKRLALMWNACRHLTDRQLAQLALAGFSLPLSSTTEVRG